MSTAIHRLRENQKASKRLVSKSFNQWQHEVVLRLRNGGSWTRRDIAILSESPCTRAATTLHRVCKEFNIYSLNQLHHVGLNSLLRAGRPGQWVGERTCWIAALILEEAGFDVDKWIDRPDTGRMDRKGAIRLVHSQVKKRERRRA
jgi:hypothetical protein